MMAKDKNLHSKTAGTPAGETRESVKKAKAEARKAERKQESKKESQPVYNPFFNYHKRKFPIWQRLVLLISICAIALVGGAMFGYGVIGKGNPWEVFNPNTWQHILDFLRTD
ncbi:DNA-directed RNA polymerase subunit beta [Sporolactobacillus sp. Y61]|jgi:hypothetical protein|uniref:DNA-directed RNA polymerase subunit beta n=1 Tax=Sporolactobacillus sp. Y61 TaxID=3160863 RepID=A0AAU8IHP9_9BACL